MFNKDVKVPLQEAELVGTSSSNIYFKLSKTLDALDVVQGTAEDKVVGVGQVHVEAQNKDKFVGVGRGTHQSPRHLSCLLSRTYQTRCDGRDDCGRPRSNAVDWATQVSQQSKESWPEALAEQARSLSLEHWPSKQGVSTRFIG